MPGRAEDKQINTLDGAANTVRGDGEGGAPAEGGSQGRTPRRRLLTSNRVMRRRQPSLSEEEHSRQ